MTPLEALLTTISLSILATVAVLLVFDRRPRP